MSEPAAKRHAADRPLKGVFLGLGNPLLDISADVGQDILDKYDVKLNNACLCEDKHKPVYEELVKNYEVQYIAGGATQNSIRVAQWMLQKPGATGFIGCVGKDKFGQQLKQSATADGVAVHYLEDDKEPTGTCAVLINNKERSLIANLSAANAYKKESHFDTPAIQSVLSAAQYIYSAGFFLTVSPDTAEAVGAHCAEKNKVFCMNLSAPFVTQFFAEPMMKCMPYVDYMFGNESEAEAFAEKHGYADKSVKNVALQISKLPKTNSKRSRVVIITQGAESTVVAQDGVVREYAVPKLAAADIVDVNGAGDSFVGGFMASLIEGKSEKACVDAGHYAASVILKVSGCVLSGKPDFKPYQGVLLGMGNPLLDISADVGKDFLDKYGVKLNNAILCEDTHKAVYEDLVANFDVKYIAGGATQNSIRVAQWMLQEPNSTAYIGCIGNDKFGKQLKDSATADGVAVHYLEDEKEATGTCAVLVHEKERSLIANLSAANAYKKETHFDCPAIQSVLSTAQVVYSAGFFLTVSPPTIEASGAHCAEHNKVFCMNLSAPFVVQFFADPMLKCMPFVDYMFGNESEAQAFGEKHGYSDTSVENVALQMSKLAKTNGKRSRTVIITQGASDTVVVQDGKVTMYPVPKLAASDIVDVNGAGDAFVGGFLASLIQGKNEKECVDAGHYAASVILKVSGCVLSGKPDLK